MELMQFEKRSRVHVYEFVMKKIFRSVEITYLAESKFNEEIVIKTSEEEIKGPVYNHSIFRTSDDKELCRIRIEWNQINNS